MGLEDESNVVGNLFALNGEESGYNAEDWIQTIEIDEKTFFRVSLAEDDGAIPGSLFACALWNGARFIAKHFAAHPAIVEGKNVIEFGAASALPSLVALHENAAVVMMTDYPNDILLANMRANLERNQHLLGSGKAEVRAHLWGSETASLRQSTLPDGKGFDVAIVAECLWLHHLHEDLLRSIHDCLVPGGLAFVCFAHHVPGHEANDLSFFDKAKKLYGFEVTPLDEWAAPHVFNQEKLVPQYMYRLDKQHDLIR